MWLRYLNGSCGNISSETCEQKTEKETPDGRKGRRKITRRSWGQSWAMWQNSQLRLWQRELFVSGESGEFHFENLRVTKSLVWYIVYAFCLLRHILCLKVSKTRHYLCISRAVARFYRHAPPHPPPKIFSSLSWKTEVTTFTFKKVESNFSLLFLLKNDPRWLINSKKSIHLIVDN